MTIIHQLCIQVAKRVFLTSNHQVVTMLEPTRLEDASKLNLRPVLLYSLVVEGVPVKYIKVSDLESPRSIFDFLSEAWSSRHKEGMPKTLKIGRSIVDAMPWLREMTHQLGIELQTGLEKDRSYTRNQSVIQDDLFFHVARLKRSLDKSTERVSLVAINEYNCMSGYCEPDEKDGWTYPYLDTLQKKYRLSCEQHAVKARTFPPSSLVPGEHWTFSGGDWLLTNQQNIPPRHPSQILHDIAVLHQDDDEIINTDFIDTVDTDIQDIEDGQTCSEVEKLLIGAWPAYLSRLAGLIGVETKTLEWYRQGRALLGGATLDHLYEVLRLEVEWKDGYGYPEPVGNYFLIGSEKSKEVIELYDELTGGGDVGVSFEILPVNNKADPSFRFLLLERWGAKLHVIAFSRGAKSSSLLDDNRKLINYSGQCIVSNGLYQDIVKAMVKATNDPSCAGKIGFEIFEKWEKEIGMLEELNA